MTEELVKVAVRVRPFNPRELNANAKLCVAMVGNQTICTNPKTNEEKKFAYDFSYWSYDGFTNDASGYSSPTTPKYADQKKVYDDLGAGVLSNAWEGYNASLFAYGQTGSGKSYSVVGYGANKGIVPLVCEDIFKKSVTIKDKTIEVTFSMLEIYSEKVRDLLDSSAERDRKSGLLIREDPKIGFYPQGLKKTLVDSYSSISKLMDEGTALRTIASTNMNATSSRAHTIVVINLVQKYKNDNGKEMAKSSIINLVDLAGSERANATGATGDRLKEGAAINLSLTSLGNVISALADNSAGKNVRVPYRDSVLTKLLMNALGGNSKTIMIAAISPADINYDETISTLRYADRAKQIKCKAVVNEDPTEKLIADLREENARLKKLLSEGKIDPTTLAAIKDGSNDKAAEERIRQEEEAMRKQLEENDKAMKLMHQTYEEKLAAAKAQSEQSQRSILLEKAKTTPHLTNVNMDPSLSGSIKLLLEGEGRKIVGLPGKSDISLLGIGIQENHAAITSKNGIFSIERLSDSKVLRNGQPVTSLVELCHLDRLVFGASQYYLFINPAKASKSDPMYTFEDAQNEIGKATGVISSSKNMTQAELQCQSEILDLLPSIEEANMISVTMDKKVKFTAIAVSAESRGEYDGIVKPFVAVKNFQLGLEWVWSKDKFLDRKHDITEYYLDFKDNGVIDKEKNKIDPFFESPDTFTQLGTAVVFPKSFAYNISSKGDSKIIDFKSREAGLLNVEILPCTATGSPISEKDFIKNPTVDLLNKNVNFIIKINMAKIHLSDTFDDIYCQFQVFKDPTIYKTNTIKANNNGSDFKFIKQFTFNATKEFLDFIINNVLFIQVWTDQKNVKPNPATANISTKEYFEREKQQTNLISGKAINDNVDPEKQRLKDDLNVAVIRGQKNEIIINNLYKLVQLAGNNHPISGATLKGILAANSEGEANKIINEFANSRSNGHIDHQNSRIESGDATKSQACNIL